MSFPEKHYLNYENQLEIEQKIYEETPESRESIFYYLDWVKLNEL